ncbi:MAG: DUF3179 domain-containing protein [Anaerolineae bacterium]|nr:DUF3179 domain-containing protein [Anaerolineae bacterium]MCI0608090.1 DUF3179 domain-containing protein [Anaerolineae bacterium]
MKTPAKFAFAVFLFLSACAPAAPVPTDVPPSPEKSLTPTLLPLLSGESPPARAESEFKTDFRKHSVPYSEILSGGPPKDGIPALKDPQFVSVSEADAWLKPAEPVILVQVGDDARAYPIQILIWHEIANNTVGGEPLVVTFCPLCNTAIAFKRTVNGQVLDFGTTGRLRYSNLIMYDRQTETWWQQATGEAIAGELTGTRLEFFPAAIISWEDFKASYPQGEVLSRETGYPRDYGHNPYIGYDDVNNPPFLYQGPATPDQLPPVARVLTIDLNGEAVAYPYAMLEQIGAANDTVGGEAVVIIWQPGTVSPLDGATTANGRDVGTAAAFSRQLDGQTLSFTFIEGKILDDQTKSEWNILGQGMAGELKGKQLTPLISINHFWFSWAAFKPETRIYQP